MKIVISGVAGDMSRNVKTLLETPAGTVVYDRDYGLDQSGIDLPPDVAAPLLMVQIEEKLARYEPRAVLSSVAAETDPAGEIILRVVIGNAGTE